MAESEYPGVVPDFTEERALLPRVGDGQDKLYRETQAGLRTFGPNPHGTYPTVAERLGAIEALLRALGYGTRVALIVENGSAAPTTSMHVTADILAVEGVLCGNLTDRPLDITLDMTSVGKNGRMGSLADGWWYPWVGVNPGSGEVAGTIQKDIIFRDDLNLGDASFEGLTHWRRVGSAIRAGGSLLRRRQQDATVIYDNANDLGVSYQTSWHTQSLASFVPPTSRIATIDVRVDNTNAGSAAFFQARPTGASSGAGRSASLASLFVGTSGVTALTVHVPLRVWLDTSQQFDWQMSAAAAGGLPVTYLLVLDYEDQV